MIQHIKVKMFWISYYLVWIYILARIKWSFLNVSDVTILSKYFVKKSLMTQIKGYPMKVTSYVAKPHWNLSECMVFIWKINGTGFFIHSEEENQKYLIIGKWVK